MTLRPSSPRRRLNRKQGCISWCCIDAGGLMPGEFYQPICPHLSPFLRVQKGFFSLHGNHTFWRGFVSSSPENSNFPWLQSGLQRQGSPGESCQSIFSLITCPSNQLSAVSRTHGQYPAPHHPCYHLRQTQQLRKCRRWSLQNEAPGACTTGIGTRRRKTGPIISLRHLPLVCSLLAFIYPCL